MQNNPDVGAAKNDHISKDRAKTRMIFIKSRASI